MPAPKRQFSRPSINLGGPKKDWQEVEVQKLSIGDNVRGWGVVENIAVNDFGDTITVTWKNGTQSLLVPGDVVTAFTAV